METMTPEYGNLQEPKSPEAKGEMLDARWYEQFREILSSDDTENAYIPDTKELEIQKSKFLSGEIDTPNPILKNLDLQKLNHRQLELMELKKSILEKEQDETVKQLYRWRINEELARARMYETSKHIQELRSDPSANQLELRRLETRFDRYNSFIYGEPSVEVFSDALLTINTQVDEDLLSNNENLNKAAQELHDCLPQNMHFVKIEDPDQETFESVKQAVLDDIADFKIEMEAFPEKMLAQDIVDTFTDQLEKIGAKDYVALIDDSGRRLITISHAKRKFDVPITREVGPKKMKELTVHEVLTHALRAATGEKSILGLTAIGLDRYERAEEGLATARTQSQKEEFNDYASLVDFLAVGLARGLDHGADGTPNFRNFKEVYDILYKYHYYKQIKLGKDVETAETKASGNAWNNTRMCFRGSGHSTAGICNREKLMYREGNIEIWGQLDNDPEILRKYMISLGKVDTNNQRHLYALHQLRVISKDELEKIEEAIATV